MINLKLKHEITKFIESLGIKCFGFTKCRKFDELYDYYESKKLNKFFTEFEEEDIEKRINPFLYMENGETIISIAVPYYREGFSYNENFSKYTQGLDYHHVVGNYLKQICEFLKLNGYEGKSFCDSNNLPERYIAYLCDYGHIGRNSLFYTELYGSYVFLGEVITNAKLCDELKKEDYIRKYNDISNFKHCGKCNNCIRKCPNDVLIEKNFRKCVSNLTQQKHLDDEEINKLNGMIFGCDICQDVCPKNRNREFSFDDKFDVQELFNFIDDFTIANMDNKFFKENFKKVSCSWRGKNLLKRNVIIKNKNDIDFIENLNYLNVEYLNNYKNRILCKKRK